MDKRKYKLVNKYLSEVLFSDLKKMECKFVGDIGYWSSGDDVSIMIEDNDLKLSKKLWYTLMEHFSLSLDEIHMVMVGWVKENLGITEKLCLGKCSYTLYRTINGNEKIR